MPTSKKSGPSAEEERTRQGHITTSLSSWVEAYGAGRNPATVEKINSRPKSEKKATPVGGLLHDRGGLGLLPGFPDAT